jgi:hypothetical protein
LARDGSASGESAQFLCLRRERTNGNLLVIAHTNGAAIPIWAVYDFRVLTVTYVTGLSLPDIQGLIAIHAVDHY